MSVYYRMPVFNRVECDGREQMALAQSLIAHEGRGVILWLDHEGRGHGHLALLRSRALQAQGWSQPEAYRRLGSAADARDDTSAAAILRDLGVLWSAKLSLAYPRLRLLEAL